MKITQLNEREIILEATICKKEKGKNEKIRGNGETSHFARQTTLINILYVHVRRSDPRIVVLFDQLGQNIYVFYE
jgi:hypothetical protein